MKRFVLACDMLLTLGTGLAVLTVFSYYTPVWIAWPVALVLGRTHGHWIAWRLST